MITKNAIENLICDVCSSYFPKNVLKIEDNLKWTLRDNVNNQLILVFCFTENGNLFNVETYAGEAFSIINKMKTKMNEADSKEFSDIIETM